MAWEDIIPQRGARSIQPPGVTISWRAKAGAKPSMYICIAAHMARTLGWEPRQRVAVQRNLSAGLMRVALSDDRERTYSLHGTTGARSLALMPRPPGLDHLTASKPAAEVVHRVEGGALILEMPAWAIPPTMADKARSLVDKPAAMADKLPAPEPETNSAQLGPIPPDAPVKPVLTVKWTEERNAVIRRMYPVGASGEEMAPEVNKLPGLEDATPKQCLAQAGNLGLRRNPPPAPPPPVKASANAGVLGRASLPAENPDKAEAVKMLEAGIPARVVADDMGLPLSDVSNWAAEVRARKQGQAA